MTPEQLVEMTGCTQEAAEKYAEHIAASMQRWGITGTPAIPAFIAQIAIESAFFTRVKESLYFTTASRLIDVWPDRFGMPDTEDEMDRDVLDDGKRNALRYLRNPTKLADYVYFDENRGPKHKLGNTEPGDGSKYIGRGLKQLTGKNNYAAYQRASGVMVLDDPELLCTPSIAADSAGWFWNDIDGTALLLNSGFTALSRRVNGGTVGLKERTETYSRALKVAV